MSSSATAQLRPRRAVGAASDPRVERTRAALLAAFNHLLLADGYEAITPALIATTAGVARSTFYVHFGSKPALLRQALQPVLQPLADTVAPAPRSSHLESVLEHFWEQRRLARAVMAGRPRLIVQDRLAELIESNLKRRRVVTLVPTRLAAAYLAHGQVAMLDGWLAGREPCAASTLANAMATLADATLGALQGR